MLQNLLHKHRGLAGGYRQTEPPAGEDLQHPGHARVDLVLIHSLVAETLPVFFHGRQRLFLLHAVKLHKTVFQRRSDKGLQLVQIRLLNAETL